MKTLAFRCEATLLKDGEPVDGRTYEVTHGEDAGIVLAYYDTTIDRVQTSLVGPPDMLIRILMQALTELGEANGFRVEAVPIRPSKKRRMTGDKNIDLYREIRAMLDRLERGEDNDDSEG